MRNSFYEQVYAIVRRIPAGQVSTYGRIAAMLDAPRASRAVGYALRALIFKGNDSAYEDIPWYRVIGANGMISLGASGAARQKEWLQKEGVCFREDGKIDFKVYLWEGLLPHEVEQLKKVD